MVKYQSDFLRSIHHNQSTTDWEIKNPNIVPLGNVSKIGDYTLDITCTIFFILKNNNKRLVSVFYCLVDAINNTSTLFSISKMTYNEYTLGNRCEYINILSVEILEPKQMPTYISKVI